MKYQLEKITEPGAVLRVQDFDGAPPTLAPEKGLVWIPYVAPVPPVPTPEQIAAELEYALDRFIHKAVWERRFDSLAAARGVAGLTDYTGPRKAIASSLAVWAETCYDAAIDIHDAVMGGRRAIPTKDELLAEMPEIPSLAGPVVRTWSGPT